MASRLTKQNAVLVAPASVPKDSALLDSTVETMTKSGISIKRLRDTFENFGYLAGSDDIRAEEFNKAIADEESTLIVCARGGYGVLRMLDQVDYNLATLNPKILIGYSDITALQLALWTKAGWKSVSGPMPGVDWPKAGSNEMKSLEMAFDAEEPYEIIGPGGEVLEPVYPGSCQGVILGGNLSLITKLVGSDYLPDLSGAILFIEEIGEAPYQVDGHLSQLALSGQLDNLGGLVCGTFTEWSPDPKKPSLTYSDVIKHYASKYSLPCATNLQYGHIAKKNSMPIGVRATLQVEEDSASLVISKGVQA